MPDAANDAEFWSNTSFIYFISPRWWNEFRSCPCDV